MRAGACGPKDCGERRRRFCGDRMARGSRPKPTGETASSRSTERIRSCWGVPKEPNAPLSKCSTGSDRSTTISSRRGPHVFFSRRGPTPAAQTRSHRSARAYLERNVTNTRFTLHAQGAKFGDVLFLVSSLLLAHDVELRGVGDGHYRHHA